jgi:hypothetical protein
MLGLLLAVGSVGHAEHRPQTTCCVKPEPQHTAPPLEQKAINLLIETTNRLASARTLAFNAVVMDEGQNSGGALTYRTTSDVLMERPDKLRVITSGNGPFSELYYDGRMISQFFPAMNFARATTAPPTIDDALKAAYNSFRIYFPFMDIILADGFYNGLECLEKAVYLGQARASDGMATDVIAYTINGTCVQIWIGVQDKLPRMMLTVIHDGPLQLQHQVEFSNWQIDQPVSSEAFDVNSAMLAAQGR